MSERIEKETREMATATCKTCGQNPCDSLNDEGMCGDCNADRWFKRITKRRREMIEAKLDEWQDRFADHAAEALEWSEPIFNMAAEHEAIVIAQTRRSRGTSWQKILEDFEREARDFVVFPTSRSTSSPANEMKAHRAGAKARLAAELRRALQHGKEQN